MGLKEYGYEIVRNAFDKNYICQIKEDIEKILPLMLAYYYKLNIYERLD